MKRMKSLAAAVAVAGAMLAAPAASAAELTPAQVAGDTQLSEVRELTPTEEIEGQKWYQKYADDDRVLKLEATSHAMDGRAVTLDVIKAQNPDRHTIYMPYGTACAVLYKEWLHS